MHEDIKRFGHTGTTHAGADKVKIKERAVQWLEAEMRDEGFVPALDIEAQYSQSYNSTTGNFDFEISIYGLYVGEEKAWRAAGVMNGRTIMMSTPQHKSKVS